MNQLRSRTNRRQNRSILCGLTLRLLKRGRSMRRRRAHSALLSLRTSRRRHWSRQRFNSLFNPAWARLWHLWLLLSLSKSLLLGKLSSQISGRKLTKTPSEREKRSVICNTAALPRTKLTSLQAAHTKAIGRLPLRAFKIGKRRYRRRCDIVHGKWRRHPSQPRELRSIHSSIRENKCAVARTLEYPVAVKWKALLVAAFIICSAFNPCDGRFQPSAAEGNGCFPPATLSKFGTALAVSHALSLCDFPPTTTSYMWSRRLVSQDCAGGDLLPIQLTRRPPPFPPRSCSSASIRGVRLRTAIGRKIGGSMATWRSLGHSLDGPAVTNPWLGQPSHVEGGCSAAWPRLRLSLASPSPVPCLSCCPCVCWFPPPIPVTICPMAVFP